MGERDAVGARTEEFQDNFLVRGQLGRCGRAACCGLRGSGEPAEHDKRGDPDAS